MEAAAKADSATLIRELINQGADIETTENGSTPLHVAARAGLLVLIGIVLILLFNFNQENVVELVSLGANMEAINKNKRTALGIAARLCKQDIVQKLVNLGANIHPNSPEHKAPLHSAALGGTQSFLINL